MSEYSKKTVAELQEILKSRSLPSSGKKAELIARLTEADQAAEPIEAAEPTSVTEAPPVQAEPVASPPEQTQTEDAPTEQINGAAPEPVGEADAVPAIEQKTFALNLAASDIDEEMRKRRQRAERFNTGGQADAETGAAKDDSVGLDAVKQLERAKRFGTGETTIGRLDEALSSERERGPRGTKRGLGAGEEASALDDPGLKKTFNRKGRFGNRRRGGPGQPTAVAKPSAGAYASGKDRAAAEARKKRFATQS